MCYVNNNLSKKLNGRNVNWFPNGKSLATTVAESVEVSIYGIKPSSVPTESIPGGFGYGTLFVVGGRGDEGYGYGYAIYNGSNATGSRISAIYDKGSGWNEYVSKSDLINTKYLTNEFNAYNDTIVLTSTATDGSQIQLSTDGTNLYLKKKLKGATDWTMVWKK